jgi:hypothetical protein
MTTNVDLKNETPTFGNVLLGAVYRLILVILAPLFMIYMMFPPLWIIEIPYWIITDRDLMEDWCKMYGV